MYLVGYHFLPYSFGLCVCTMFPCGWSWGGAGITVGDGFAGSQNQHITYIIPAGLHHSLRQACCSHSEDKAETLGAAALGHSSVATQVSSGTHVTLLVSEAAQGLLLTTLNSINQGYIPHAVPGAM